jgi:catechol 2,3-dioxygenase-like lactoylglutathione lyase family enzyme
MGFRYNDLNDAAGGAPRAVSAATGYMFDAQGTQHVNYRGDDGHVHELWWNSNGWHHNDLTNAAGGAPVAVGDPVGYMFNATATQHVNYLGEDGHIHELWLDNTGWHHNDLTNAVGGAPRAVGNPKGYMFDAQGTQHVNYRGDDGRVHELWWNSNGWHHNDLTNAAGNAPVAASDPKGYMFDAQGTQHVNYRGVDGHIHELWIDNSGWHHNDLSNAAGSEIGVAAAATPYGYMYNAQGTQHVIFTTVPSDVHEFWWNNDGWHHTQLTHHLETGQPPAGETAGYVFEAQGTQHVNYRAGDGHVYEIWWDNSGQLHHNDLTAETGAPLAIRDPKGYMFDGQGTQHVIYVRAPGNVMELYWVP